VRCTLRDHAIRSDRTASTSGQKSLRETTWIVLRISVACTSERRSSARVSASRSNPAIRDQRPM
jgi:hypothetical protein